MSRHSRLTLAQIEQVGRRLNPAEGTVVVFSRDGVVLHTHAERQGTMELHGEVYSVVRAGMSIRAERIWPDVSH